MKQTIQVNIGGCAFSIDQEAYTQVERYLDELRRYYNGNPDAAEIVDDIEERLGELLLERCGSEGVVTAPDVRYATGILGTPSTLDGGSTAAGEKAAEQPQKRLYRNPDGKVIAGVCNGLAAYLNWDVTLVRLLFAGLFAASMFSDVLVAVMPVLYILCWIAMPNADTVQKQCELRGERLSAAGIGQQYSAGKPADSQPSGRILGRVLGVIFGITLFLTGLSLLGSGALVAAVPSIASLNPDVAEGWQEFLSEFGLSNLEPIGISTLIVLGIVFAIPCIIAIYYGILLTFGLKSPKWRPGLILLIIWAIALVVLIPLLAVDIASIVSAQP